MRILSAAKRIWNSANNIFKKIFNGISKGTTTTVQAVVDVICLGLTVVFLLVIFVSILAVSLPIGIFGGGREQNKTVCPAAS